MEFTVKDLGTSEGKSIQEREQELLDKAAAEEQEGQQEEQQQEQQQEQQEEQQQEGLKEEDVLSYIKNRYNKEITSVEQLFDERESQEELPEDVKAYYEYRKKTGRGIEDYVKLNRDFDSMDDSQVLREYLLMSGEAIDGEDADMMVEDYAWDEDLDEERDIKKKKLAYKKAVIKAKDYLNQQKESYKQPLESSTAAISDDEKEQYEAYKQYIAKAKTQEEEYKRKRSWFEQKTKEVFSENFKGFDFKIGDSTLKYAPTSAEDLMKSQIDTNNFVGKFLDEDGLLKDAQGYHKALAVAMNPDRFAKFFYEQGKSDATEDVTRKIKNVDMSERRAPEVTSKDGLKIRAINPSEGRGLRIKSRKK